MLPHQMVGYVRALGADPARTKGGRRQLRLLACGCCRQIWPYLSDERLTRAVSVAEEFADERATRSDLAAAKGVVEPLCLGSYASDAPGVNTRTAASLVFSAVAHEALAAANGVMTVYKLPLAGYRGDEPDERLLICQLIRDIFGNPFRPVTFAPEWRTDTAVELARQMYTSRDFSAMPILADAFQDAGCDSGDILNHCRDPEQVHVCGCWVVDWVLGKA